MTAGERALQDYKRSEARAELLVHASIGAVVGFVVGLYLWFKWDWRLRIWSDSHLLDSWPALIIFVGGFTITVGALAGLYKARFWSDLKNIW